MSPGVKENSNFLLNKKSLIIIGLFLMAGVFIFALLTLLQWQSNNSQSAEAVTFSWATQVVDAPGNLAGDQAIHAVDANTIFIAYKDVDNQDLKFAKSTNGGSSWTLSDIDTNFAGTALDMEAVDANTIFVIYSGGGAFATNDLRLAKSTNGGTSWTISTIIASNDIRTPHLDVVDANTLVASYWCNAGCFDSRFAISTNGGTSWTVNDPFPGISGGSNGDVYAVDANNIFLVYDNSGDVFCAVSTNGGTSFTLGNLVDANPQGGSQERAIHGLDANTVYITYGRPLRVAKTTNACGSFNLSDIGSGDTGFTSDVVVLDVNNIFIGTYDITSDDALLYSSDDAGATWDESLIQSTGDPGFRLTVSPVSSTKAFVSYGDGIANDLYFAAGEPFGVLSITPSQNALDVSASSNIVIVFDASLNIGTVTQANLPVFGSGPLLDGAYSFSTTTFANDTVTFNPDNDFEIGAEIEVVTTNNILSAGALPVAAYVSNFIVEATAGNGVVGAEVTYNITGTDANGVSSGDFDNDGDVDLVVAEEGANDKLAVLFNNGVGQFSGQTDYATSNPRSVAVADYDSDGFLDLGVIRTGVNLFGVLLNDGFGAFPAQVTYAIGTDPNDVTAADFDGDGDIDVATTNRVSNNVSVLLNNGAGVFAAHVTYAVGTFPFNLDSADMDNDGDIDIITGNGTTNNVSVLMNNGDGTFAAAVNYASSLSPYGVTAADLNGDGFNDIATSGSTNAGSMSVLLNNGDGTLATKVDYPGGNFSANIESGDFDADGDIDVATADSNDATISVFKNNGNGTFAARQSFPTPTNGISSFHTAEVNNDGAIDFFGTGASFLKVHLADLPPTITIVQPNGGETLTPGSTFNIFWTASDDSGTVATIDLELQTNPFNPIPGATGLANGSTYPFDFKWGSFGVGAGNFASIWDVEVSSSGTVYTSESIDRIQAWDQNGNFLFTWGSSGTGNGQFDEPQGIAIDSSNNVYVVENQNHRVQKFDANGNFLLKWGRNGGDGTPGSGQGEFQNPQDLAVDSLGNVYVADLGNQRVQRFDSDGLFQTDWGSVGAGDGEFLTLFAVAVDSLDNILAVDSARDDVQRFTSVGGFLSKFGSSGTGNGQFVSPLAIEIDSEDNIFVSDPTPGPDRVQKFDSGGTFITQFGSSGTGDGQFQQGPIGFGINDSGRVYVADRGGSRVQSFLPGGTFSWLVPGEETIIGLIRGTATDGGAQTGQDQSDGVFTIEGGGTSIQRLLPQPGAPAAPVIVGGQAVSFDSIQWNFTDNADDETGFKLFENGTLDLTVNQANAGFIQETGLTANTEYSGRTAVAFNDVGDSAPSAEFDPVVTLMPDVTPKVTNIGLDSVTVGVNEETPNLPLGQSGLMFELVLPTTALSAAAVVSSGWIQEEQFTFTGLEPEAEFQLRAQARNQEEVESAISPLSEPMMTSEIIAPGMGISLNVRRGDGSALSRVVDPREVMLVTMTVSNTGNAPATNVLANLVLPEFVIYRPGTLVLDGVLQTDAADVDVGQGSNNGVAAIWASFGPDQSVSLTFELGFDIEGLRALSGQAQAAANPLLNLQASLSFAESTEVLSASSPVIEPDLTVFETGEPVLPPPPPTPPTVSPPIFISPPIEEFVIDMPGVAEDELGVTGKAEVINESIKFSGTTTEPFTEVTIIINGTLSITAISDENGEWSEFVSADQLALLPGESKSVEINAFASKEEKQSTVVSVGRVTISRAKEAELVKQLEQAVAAEGALGAVKAIAGLVEDNEDAIEATLVIAAPVVVITSAPLLGYLPYLPTLLYHFFTYLLGLLGIKKKKRFYGVVYDSISKLPLSLAILRIREVETNKLIQTRVTDKLGRYDVLLNPGRYALEVIKPQFGFPSKIVRGGIDGEYTHLYEAERGWEIAGEQIIIPDVPMDPMDFEKQWRASGSGQKLWLVIQRVGHFLAAPLLLIGAIISALLVITVPVNPINWIVAAFYIVLLLGQLRLRPAHEKDWGIVFDVQTGQPVPLATIQLVEKEFGKISKTRLTNYQGRYSFLPEPGDYILKANKAGFTQDSMEGDKVSIKKPKGRLTHDVKMRSL